MDTVFKSTDLREQCLYCGKNLNDSPWTSEHDLNRHYKSTVCECGKKVTLRVDFWGSGHDKWNQYWKKNLAKQEKCKIRTLENLVCCIK
ncbi:MAG: hypothetical protein R6V53_06920 [Candidatus Woesearchaeota archaeon]